MSNVFASDATRAVIADWVELELLSSSRNSISDSDVLRADEILDDEPDHAAAERDMESGEELDREILETASEQRRAALWDELTHRQSALGDSYPFVLTTVGSGGWALTRRTGGAIEKRAARVAYIAALYMASFKHDHIETLAGDGRKIYKELEKAIPYNFQALAALASANLLGHAYWFGWPRPDKKPFREALSHVVELLGHGVVRERAPKNRTRIKDGTVDIVAWRPFGDRLYGDLVIYGQVASGNNWQSKPVQAYLRGRFLDHFTDHPSAQFLGATFMPYLLHTELATPSDGDLATAMMDDSRQLEKDLGIVVDRMRLTELIAEGMPGAERLHNFPPVYATTLAILRWVRDCGRYCLGTKA